MFDMGGEGGVTVVKSSQVKSRSRSRRTEVECDGGSHALVDSIGRLSLGGPQLLGGKLGHLDCTSRQKRRSAFRERPLTHCFRKWIQSWGRHTSSSKHFEWSLGGEVGSGLGGTVVSAKLSMYLMSKFSNFWGR